MGLRHPLCVGGLEGRSRRAVRPPDTPPDSRPPPPADSYGIFKQLIKDGAQVEVPDYWLTFGNPWEIQRQDIAVPIRFYGSTRKEKGEDGKERTIWSGGEIVMALAYDNPIPGYDTYNTINLRLWKAAPARECAWRAARCVRVQSARALSRWSAREHARAPARLRTRSRTPPLDPAVDFASFNSGDYLQAVESRQRAENISAVLYPSDSTYSGKELRLKQQYMCVAALSLARTRRR